MLIDELPPPITNESQQTYVEYVCVQASMSLSLLLYLSHVCAVYSCHILLHLDALGLAITIQ